MNPAGDGGRREQRAEKGKGKERDDDFCIVFNCNNRNILYLIINGRTKWFINIMSVLFYMEITRYCILLLDNL